MFRTSLTGLDQKQLRRWLFLFFLALAVPAGILIYQAYHQLKWEAYYQYRLLAGELGARINSRYVRLLNQEEARSFADYTFLNVAGDPKANVLQRSPLSGFPVASAIPGVIGYFQIDARGEFSTPLLPTAGTGSQDYGVSQDELVLRLNLQDRIWQILSDNRLVQGGETGPDEGMGGISGLRDEDITGMTMPLPVDEGSTPALSSFNRAASAPSAEKPEQQTIGQAAFDRLNREKPGREQKKEVAGDLGRVEDLELDMPYQEEPSGDAQYGMAESRDPAVEKRARRERSALPEPVPESGVTRYKDLRQTEERIPARAPPGAITTESSQMRIRTFESEIDPFEFSLLDSGHFVLYRKVWRDDQRYIQGALIRQKTFLGDVIESAFRESSLFGMSDLIIAYQGSVMSAISGQAAQEYNSGTEELRGSLLYQMRLSDPLSELELIFSINRLPAGPGGRVILWLALVLALILPGGFYLLYRSGTRQIELARQQQDFVSAVSHELKTPLTSIRMYGEMLREGWASEDRKATYYEYIHEESERLSRLISNVLQLARMTRNDLQVDAKSVTVSELMDGIHSRIISQAERAGFDLNLDCSAEALQAVINVDPDWFTQIIINLVDNAIKFSSRAERKAVDLGCELTSGGSVVFTVRDYGPGIPRDQMKKIFRLFYRSGNELTRETAGTGIGLALVHQLAQAMNGETGVDNREPGAEFRISFPGAD